MLSIRVLALATLLAVVLAVPLTTPSVSLTEPQYQFLFREFIKAHSKTYHVDEFHSRFSTFKSNVAFIHHHNSLGKSFSLAINHLTDMTKEEFRAKHLGFKMSAKAVHELRVAPAAANTSVPDEIDWRTKNAVTPVKNQGQCGGCWSFSTAGAIEGAWAIAKGQLVSLSEQQLIDCSTSAGNEGCNGGLMDQAFDWIIKSNKNGICSEASYPFTAKNGKCRKCTAVATISSFQDVKPNDEDALAAAVAQQPVSIALEADQQVFQFYSGGVLDDTACGANLDHAVLAAGYGKDSASGKNFWLVKNSWGPTWGDAGFIKIVRNVGGESARQCGLTSAPSYPVV